MILLLNVILFLRLEHFWHHKAMIGPYEFGEQKIGDVKK